MDKLTLSQYLRKVEVDQKTKDNYRQRYQEVRDKITSRWFTISSLNHMVVYLRIPSEKVNVFYDVLIEFPFGKNSGTYRGFRNSNIKVYSNCPSFVFINARVFDRKGFLIPWTKHLYDAKTFEPPPPEKMEEELKKDVKYEKSLYFAALYLDELDAIQVLTEIQESVQVPTPPSIVQIMKSPEQVLRSRTRKEEKQKKKEQIKRDKLSDTTIKANGKGKVGKVSTIKSISRSKKVRHI